MEKRSRNTLEHVTERAHHNFSILRDKIYKKNINFFAWELYKNEITTKSTSQDPVIFKYES